MVNWKDIIIEDAAKRRFSGVDAREFVKNNLKTIWPPREPRRNAIWLRFGGKDYVSHSAVTLLVKHLDAIDAKLTSNVSPGSAGDRTRIRREELNTFSPKDEYEIELNLGDVDLLFEPIGGGEPSKDRGVQQRLQALGYLYPLGPSRLEKQAEKCWDYYKRVHAAEGDLLELLRRETRNNILAQGLPLKGEVFQSTALPAPESFGAIRFPGAYAFTFGEGKEKTGPDPEYLFKQGDDQFALEELLVSKNEPMGKIPLVAMVRKILPNGKKEPAPGVKVYFQLLRPEVVPEGHALAGGHLRTTVMDYAVDPKFAERWKPDPPEKYSREDWERAKVLANALWREKMGNPNLVSANQKFDEAAKRYAPAHAEASRKQAVHKVKLQEYSGLVAQRAREANQAITARRDKLFHQESAARAAAEATNQSIVGHSTKISKWVQDSNTLRAKLKLPPHDLTPPPKPETNVAAVAAAAEEPLVVPGGPPPPGGPPASGAPPPPSLRGPKAPASTKLSIAARKPARSEEEINADNQKKLTETDGNIAAEVKARAAAEAKMEVQNRQADDLTRELQKVKDQQEAKRKEIEATDEAKALFVPVKKAEDDFGEATQIRDEVGRDFDAKKKSFDEKRQAALDAAIADIGQSNPSLSVAAAAKDILDDAVKALKSYDAALWRERLRQNATFPTSLKMLGSKPLDGAGAGEIPHSGPARFVHEKLADNKKLAPEDPQRRNAPERYGGRFELPVPGNIFAVKSCLRFNDGHGKYGSLPVAEAAGGVHKDAISAMTNGEGYAGVIFTPSRCGGDSYRLRAYLDPDLIDKGRPCPQQETGTLVVWRNMRMSRYYRKGPFGADPAKLSDGVKELMTWPATNAEAKKFKYNSSTWENFFTQRMLASGLVDVSFARGAREGRYTATDAGRAESGYRPIDVHFPGFEEAFRQCYCEVLDDTNGIETLPPDLHGRAVDALKAMLREELPAAKSTAIATAQGKYDNADTKIAEEKAKGVEAVPKALQEELEEAKKELIEAKALPHNIDLDALIFHDSNSPFFVNLRHWAHYNFLKHDAFEELKGPDAEKVKILAETYGASAMLRVIGKEGLAPGLTLVQAEIGDSWDKHALNESTIFSSGIGTQYRAALVFYTEGTHRADKFPYSATSNVVHELGHVLMGNHQPDIPGGDKLHHQPQPAVESSPSVDQVACVMGYMGCYGEFCGCCNLRLRGWKTTTSLRDGGV